MSKRGQKQYTSRYLYNATSNISIACCRIYYEDRLSKGKITDRS